MSTPLNDGREEPGAWKRNGFVWLILSGPAIVVVAAIVTAWIAWHGADPVLEEQYHRAGQADVKASEMGAMLPAMKARNHAATPDDHLPIAQPKAAK